MKIGNKEFNIGDKTYIMGILNVTPDSFSDGGNFNNLESALRQTEKMINEGADIIDVGGESTRPGHTVITEDEEILRVIPVIENIKKNFDIPISIDTYKSKVAEAALNVGADIVNDIWGFKRDKKIADVTKRFDAVCCLTHNRDNTKYINFMDEVLDDLRESVDIAVQAGISKDKIIIDPGVGFGKTYENNIEIINNVDRLNELGFPILLASSRKSVIGITLDLPVNERLEGTLATTVFGVIKGCGFVRVHDVKENKRIIMMTEKLLGRI
jgi:dihydropteroate synthase